MTATYNTEAAKFSRQLAYLVKLTVPGDVAGSQIFYFSLRDGPTLSHLLGVTVYPTLKTVEGRATRIKSDENLTERPSLNLQFFDDPNEGTFDSAVFSVLTGSTFWKRLKLTQPYVEGWTVEVKRGFYASGFTLSDFQPFFKGRTEDLAINTQGEVTLKIKSSLNMIDKEAPGPVKDQNIAIGDIATTASTFTVVNGSQLTSPSTWASRDFMPMVLRLETADQAETEDVIVKSISSDVVTVQDNYLGYSESLGTSPWSVGANFAVSTLARDLGPFGGAVNAHNLTATATNAALTQDTSLAAASITVTFSVWLRYRTSASSGVTIRVQNASGSTTTDTTPTLTADWQRVSVTKTFSGAAGNVTVKIISGGTALDIYAFGAQLEQSSSANNYAATTTNSGVLAGRGAFGSSVLTHKNAAIKEILVYRNWISEEGVHPVWILRDLVNRSGVALADVDESSFTTVFNYSRGSKFRRGRHTVPTATSTTEEDNSVTEPSPIQELMKQVKAQALLDIWESEEGDVKIGSQWYSYLATDTRTTLSDSENILMNSSSFDQGCDSRISRVHVYYNRIQGETDDKPASFENVHTHFNNAAESVSGKKEIIVFSDWIYRRNEALFVASKSLSLFLQGAKRLKFKADIKEDVSVVVGSLIDVTTDDYPTVSGTAAVTGTTTWRVVSKKELPEEGQIELELMKARNNKYALIAPAGTPVYDSSSAAEKKYLFIGDTNNQLGAGNATGYVIL